MADICVDNVKWIFRFFIVICVISIAVLLIVYGSYVNSFEIVSENFGYFNGAFLTTQTHGKMAAALEKRGNERAVVPIVWMYTQSGIQKTYPCEDMENTMKTSDFHKSFIGIFPVFIHDPKHDYISSQIKANLDHEPHISNIISLYFTKYKDMNLIDVGANIGVFSLKAAIMGRSVISVEAIKSNIQHICASAKINEISERMNLIHNAVSDNHTSVSFVMGKDGEFGATFMDEVNLRSHKVKKSVVKFDTQNLITINTVVLDDLLHLPNIDDFKTAFIKIDIEGSEHKALLGARKLFRMLNVRGVLMEWRWHVERPESKSIILEFMDEHGFEPYALTVPVNQKLDGKTMKNHDVLWLPK